MGALGPQGPAVPADGLHSHQHAPVVLTIGPPPAFHSVHVPVLASVIDGLVFSLAVWWLLASGSAICWTVLRCHRPTAATLAR